MTDEGSPPSSEAQLNAELKELLRRAYENGVDVEGGWECRNGMDHPDWDVVISEVTKNDGT